jgi:hypothetical protein
MLRSILAVLAGWLAVGVLVVLTDGVLHKMYPNDYVHGKVPPDNLMMVSLATATLYSVLGGYITARLARHRPWHHILGLIVWGEVMGIVSFIFSRGQVPDWYSLALLALWFPAVCIGGYLRAGKPDFKSATAAQ